MGSRLDHKYLNLDHVKRGKDSGNQHLTFFYAPAIENGSSLLHADRQQYNLIIPVQPADVPFQGQ